MVLEGYVTRRDLAAEFKTCTRTIARWENLPDGLPVVIVAGQRLYRIESVRKWLVARERRPNPTEPRRRRAA
jgi:hypothetical protein